MSSVHTRVSVSIIHPMGFVTSSVDFGIEWEPNHTKVREHPKVVEEVSKAKKRAALWPGRKVRVDIRDAW